MRIVRTVLVVTIALGAFVAFSGGAGASTRAASTASPKFCAKYLQVAPQLATANHSGGKYNGRSLKTLGKGLSNLAKSASGKLKSDINKMATYFKLLGSQGSAVNVGKYLASHPSVATNYSGAATDFATSILQCATTTS